MFGKTLKLFTLFGFSVKIDASWLFIMALVVWSLAGGVFPEQYPALGGWTHFAMGLIAALGLFASIAVHEMSHSLVARRYGLPMTGITLFLFGGVAEMGDEPRSPKAEFMMAAAGPAISIVIGGLFLGLWRLGESLGWIDEVVGVLRWIGYINIVLAVFNLIPGFPLDGGRLLRATLWHLKKDLRWATHVAARVGEGFGLALLGFGALEALAGNVIGGLWLILIGLFIRAAARQSYQQVLLRQALKGEPVRRFMNDSPVTVSPDTTVATLVDDYVYRLHYKMYPVVEGDRLLGCVTTRDVQGVPREQWAEATVGELSHGCGADNTLSPDDDAMDALTKMRRTGASRVMVVQAGRLSGILALKDLLEFLALKLELEPAGQGARPHP